MTPIATEQTRQTQSWTQQQGMENMPEDTPGPTASQTTSTSRLTPSQLLQRADVLEKLSPEYAIQASNHRLLAEGLLRRERMKSRQG